MPAQSNSQAVKTTKAIKLTKAIKTQNYQSNQNHQQNQSKFKQLKQKTGHQIKTEEKRKKKKHIHEKKKPGELHMPTSPVVMSLRGWNERHSIDDLKQGQNAEKMVRQKRTRERERKRERERERENERERQQQLPVATSSLVRVETAKRTATVANHQRTDGRLATAIA